MSSSMPLLVLLGLGHITTLPGALQPSEADLALAELADPPAPQIHPRPQWIRHRVRPRERTTQIAARYGVRHEDLLRWNRLDPDDPDARRRRTLRVRTRRQPAPRRKISYVVRPGDTWDSIATRFRVERLDLHAYNWRSRRLPPGRELVVWIDPGMPATVHPSEQPCEPVEPDIREDAKSVGSPHRGRIRNAVQLPESPLYTRGIVSALWGSSYAVHNLHRAMQCFRQTSGYEEEVVIGSMSRKWGGRFAPHQSHQSGRDIDIRLPLLPGIPPTDDPNPDEVDWHATWALIDSLIDTEAVSVIFLDARLHRRLYEAARVLGESPQSIMQVMKWPAWRGNGRPIVRHESGHDGHIHVRMRCGPEERRCRR